MGPQGVWLLLAVLVGGVAAHGLEGLEGRLAAHACEVRARELDARACAAEAFEAAVSEAPPEALPGVDCALVLTSTGNPLGFVVERAAAGAGRSCAQVLASSLGPNISLVEEEGLVWVALPEGGEPACDPLLPADACGECGGRGEACRDCAGTPHGPAQWTWCGLCSPDGDARACGEAPPPGDGACEPFGTFDPAAGWCTCAPPRTDKVALCRALPTLRNGFVRVEVGAAAAARRREVDFLPPTEGGVFVPSAEAWLGCDCRAIETHCEDEQCTECAWGWHGPLCTLPRYEACEGLGAHEHCIANPRSPREPSRACDLGHAYDEEGRCVRTCPDGCEECDDELGRCVCPAGWGGPACGIELGVGAGGVAGAATAGVAVGMAGLAGGLLARRHLALRAAL
jgi:hypothetical protein